MTSFSQFVASQPESFGWWAQQWHDFWRGSIGEWIITRGLRIVMLVIAAMLIARFVNWGAHRVTARIDARFQESDALVRSETTKHRQAVASVISYVTIGLVSVIVLVDITDILAIPIGSLVAPAAVLGAAFGFGAQRIVQDLLAGFFVITEKQYGFGDLVELTLGSSRTQVPVCSWSEARERAETTAPTSTV